MSPYKPYAAYKDSGVQWLGRVPEHWRVQRLKFSAKCMNSNVDKKSYDGELPARLCNYTDVYYNEKITKGLNFMHATATADELSKFTLRPGDVLLTKDSETPDDIGIPAIVERSAQGVVCGYHLTVIRPEQQTYGGYVFRALQAAPSVAQFYLGASGVTRYGLSKGAIDNLLTCLPPGPEQRQIANFLDRETARIDALIDKKQRLIELLKEKRQAVITQAVTKGLDPKVPMKDSGVEWLGEVPAHWVVVAISWVARVFNGATPSRMRPEFWEGELPWLSSGRVNDWTVTEPSERITAEAVVDAGLELAPKGSVVIGMVGQGRTRGMAARLNLNAYINQNMAAIVPERRLLAGFLHSVLSHSYESIREYGRGGQQDALNCELVGALRIPLPPQNEQAAICRHIDQEVCRCDRLVAKTLDSIDLIKERRAALITAAVTGQIDVREAAGESAAESRTPSGAVTKEPHHLGTGQPCGSCLTAPYANAAPPSSPPPLPARST